MNSTSKTTNKARTLCAKCGKMCEAQLGVFEKVCPTCEEAKIEEQKKQHPTLFNYMFSTL